MILYPFKAKKVTCRNSDNCSCSPHILLVARKFSCLPDPKIFLIFFCFFVCIFMCHTCDCIFKEQKNEKCNI